MHGRTDIGWYFLSSSFFLDLKFGVTVATFNIAKNKLKYNISARDFRCTLSINVNISKIFNIKYYQKRPHF